MTPLGFLSAFLIGTWLGRTDVSLWVINVGFVVAVAVLTVLAWASPRKEKL